MLYTSVKCKCLLFVTTSEAKVCAVQMFLCHTVITSLVMGIVFSIGSGNGIIFKKCSLGKCIGKKMVHSLLPNFFVSKRIMAFSIAVGHELLQGWSERPLGDFVGVLQIKL